MPLPALPASSPVATMVKLDTPEKVRDAIASGMSVTVGAPFGIPSPGEFAGISLKGDLVFRNGDKLMIYNGDAGLEAFGGDIQFPSNADGQFGVVSGGPIEMSAVTLAACPPGERLRVTSDLSVQRDHATAMQLSNGNAGRQSQSEAFEQFRQQFRQERGQQADPDGGDALDALRRAAQDRQARHSHPFGSIEDLVAAIHGSASDIPSTARTVPAAPAAPPPAAAPASPAVPKNRRRTVTVQP